MDINLNDVRITMIKKMVSLLSAGELADIINYSNALLEDVVVAEQSRLPLEHLAKPSDRAMDAIENWEEDPGLERLAVAFGWTETCKHEWVDTGGMMSSYCKKCDVSGRWDRAKLNYDPIQD